MGYDGNSYIIEVKLRDNVSDARFDTIRQLKPNIQMYKAFEKKLISDHPVYNDKAEEIIRFFINYRSGIIKPDRYNYFEPINKVFDENNLIIPISMLASPGGGVYLKKTKIAEVYIDNKTYSFVWVDKEYLPPKRDLPEYITVITVFFPKRKNTDIKFIVQLMNDIKETFGADNGRVYCLATGEVIAE